MDEIKLESVACDICGSFNNTVLCEARDYRYGHKKMFTFVKCLSCGLAFLNPRPTLDSIIKLYETDYTLDNKQIVPPRIETNKWKSLIKKFGRKFIGSYTDEIIDYSAGKVLDIGCGNGYVLLSLKHKGCEVFGIEANRNAVEICSNSGLNVFHGTLEEAHYPDQFFDVVIMSQVIEHLQSPKKTLKEIYRILKPGGRIYIYCPNVESYLSTLFVKYWHGWHIPFHFYGFTEKTIRRLADEGGFIINKIKTVTPTRFFIESLNSYLWGKKISNISPIERGIFLDSSFFVIAISFLFRLLDLFFPRKGDCLKVIMTKGDYLYSERQN